MGIKRTKLRIYKTGWKRKEWKETKYKGHDGKRNNLVKCSM